LGYLDKNDRVQIIDQTVDTMKIGEMESVWYKVNLSNGIIGWVYGYFINLE